MAKNDGSKIRNVVHGEQAAGLRRTLQLLTVEELAALLEVPVSSVHAWRREGTGPQYTRLGRRVYYREQDVGLWIDDNLGKPWPGAAGEDDGTDQG